MPVGFEQGCIINFLGIVYNLNRFRVASAAGGNLLISWILGLATGVARGRGDNAVDSVEGAFHAPEAAPGKGGSSEVRRIGAGLRSDWRIQAGLGRVELIQIRTEGGMGPTAGSERAAEEGDRQKPFEHERYNQKR